MLLHANLLSWENSDDSEEAQGGFPKQNVSERKVALYRQAIVYFDQGKMWEMCIKLINELRVVSERTLFDFAMLAELTQQEANYYRNIVSTERFFCEYFRVGYYGRGFPVTLRNKEFIFRGLELERLADFSQRVAAKFPDAVLMKSTDPPGEDLLLSDGQHLQIFSVKPCSLAEKEFGKTNPRVKPNMPANIAKYHVFNEVNCFLYSKPFRKNKQKGETQTQEFADLWYNNWYMVTEDAFPTVHTRSEVIKKIVVETTPIQNAIAMVSDKNREIQQVTAKQEAAGSTLTLVLKGVIDAAVNGGTALYSSAFLNESYLSKAPGDISLCEQLSAALEAQIPLLEEGLKVHQRMCGPEMAGLQEQLETQLKTMAEQLKASSAAVTSLFARFQQYKTARATGPSMAQLRNPSNIIAPLPTLAASGSSPHLAATPSPADDYTSLSLEQLIRLQTTMDVKAEIALAMFSANLEDLHVAAHTGLSQAQLSQVKQYGYLDTGALQTALQAKHMKNTRSTPSGLGGSGMIPAPGSPASSHHHGASTPHLPTSTSYAHLQNNSPHSNSAPAISSPIAASAPSHHYQQQPMSGTMTPPVGTPPASDSFMLPQAMPLNTSGGGLPPRTASGSFVAPGPLKRVSPAPGTAGGTPSSSPRGPLPHAAPLSSSPLATPSPLNAPAPLGAPSPFGAPISSSPLAAPSLLQAPMSLQAPGSSAGGVPPSNSAPRFALPRTSSATGVAPGGFPPSQ